MDDRRNLAILHAAVALLGAAALLAAGCIPGGHHRGGADTFRVTHIGPAPSVTRTLSSGPALELRFNRSVDLAALMAPGAARLDLKDTATGQSQANVPCQFLHSNDNKLITMGSSTTIGTLLNTAQPGHHIRYDLRISGSLVKDAEGHPLDGKRDGHPGSDYHGSFQITLTGP